MSTDVTTLILLLHVENCSLRESHTVLSTVQSPSVAVYAPNNTNDQVGDENLLDIFGPDETACPTGVI